MKTLSTNQAAQKLGITSMTLSRYIRAGKVPDPRSATSGGMTIHFWTEGEIERVRKLLPKIANGRKTRYKKKQSALSNQQSAKPKSKTKQKPVHGTPGSSKVGSLATASLRQESVGPKTKPKKKPQPNKAGLRKKKH